MKIFVLVIFFSCRFEHFLYVRYDFYRDGFKKKKNKFKCFFLSRKKSWEGVGKENKNGYSFQYKWMVSHSIQ